MAGKPHGGDSALSHPARAGLVLAPGYLGAEIGVGITMFRFFLAFFDEIQWTQEYVPCAYT